MILAALADLALDALTYGPCGALARTRPVRWLRARGERWLGGCLP